MTGGGAGDGVQGGGYRGGKRESLDEQEIEALHVALDDECRALAVYQSVMTTFGQIDPFVEIAQSEQRHIDALINQFIKHNIALSENPWIDGIPTFESVQEACRGWC